MRRGFLTPVRVDRDRSFPAWAQPAVAYDAAAARTRQISQGLDEVTAALRQDNMRWADWQTLVKRWAQLIGWRYAATDQLPGELQRRYTSVQLTVSGAFGRWLNKHYGTLAGQRLPEPHHLFHVPSFLAHRNPAGNRLALIVLDGMSVAAWQRIKSVWLLRHPHWQFDERLLLAQVPSITAVSRQALISGLPPARFADSLTHNRRESALWRDFWLAQGCSERGIVHTIVPTKVPRPLPDALDSTHTQAMCIIVGDIDDMVHGATQGMADVHSSLNVWLATQDVDRSSGWVEHLIQTLLDRNYLVALASDHGHVEATGIGLPQEGVTVESRTKRARIYDREHFARTVQAQYPNSTLWHDDGLLPPDRWILMADGQDAFCRNRAASRHPWWAFRRRDGRAFRVGDFTLVALNLTAGV